MRTEPGPQDQSQQGPTKKHYITKHDVIGIVMGIPLFLLGLCALGVWWIGLILLLISVGLLVPSSLYDHGKVRIIGFTALILAATVTAYCAVFLSLGAYAFLSDPPEDGEMRWIMAAVAMFWCLITFVPALPGICVLLKKLGPRPVHTTIAMVVGIAAALAILTPSFLP